MKHLAFLIASAAAALGAVPEQWVTAVSWVESSNNPAATGDGTRARGLVQFWRATWDDCSRVRMAKGLPTWPYSLAYDPTIGRAYAKSWLDHLDARLAAALGRKPTIGEVYAAHNLGLSGFTQRGYSLARCPSITQRKARWLSANTVRR